MIGLYDEFPDAEAMVATLLRDALTSVGVYSSVPNTPTYPLITVQRIGGVPVERHRLDRARIQVDVWAESKSDARDLAAQARVAIHEAEANVIVVDEFVSGYITGVTDDLGLTWQPDPVTNKDRYLFGVEIVLHAA